MKLFAIVCLTVAICCCSEKSVISGPFPQNLIAPINSTVEFRCSVNISQLIAGSLFSAIIWSEDGTAIVGLVTSSASGAVRSSTITLTVTEENLSGVAIQCSVIIETPLDQIIGGNATLITYGIVQ